MSDGDQSLVRYEVRDNDLAFITLDDPATRNALSDPLLDELIAALLLAEQDPAIRVVVLTSSHPKTFSSGGNLKAFASAQATLAKHEGLNRFPRLYTLIADLDKPVVCAANGDVFAGAFGLALACDLILARESASFACPEINVGLFPFMISALIFRNVPRVRANELMMMGERITASEAAELGVINRAFLDEQFEEQVLEWARRLATRSPLLMRMGKNALSSTRDMGLEQSLSTLQAQLALAFTADDVAEGMAAFREKRDPKWNNR